MNISRLVVFKHMIMINVTNLMQVRIKNIISYAATLESRKYETKPGLFIIWELFVFVKG